jgi:hypothetical protein
MTTTNTPNISIQDLVQREVIYCISSLVYTLTTENKLDEEQAIELWNAPIDYGAAKYELELEHDSVFKHYCDEDNRYYFGVKNQHGTWKIDPIYNGEEEAIAEWFEIYHGEDLEDYRQEIFEHWIVSSWLADKLEEQGETVVKDVLGIDYIWGRTSTGQAIWCDYVIQKIYNKLQYK